MKIIILILLVITATIIIEYNKQKNKFNNKPCNGKIEYNRLNNNFYLVHKHNDIWDEIQQNIYDNTSSISKNITNYQNFKIESLKFLFIQPLVIYKDFKNYGNNIFEKSNCDLP